MGKLMQPMLPDFKNKHDPQPKKVAVVCIQSDTIEYARIQPVTR
jgi:hypothetical protein